MTMHLVIGKNGPSSIHLQTMSDIWPISLEILSTSKVYTFEKINESKASVQCKW
jgi:hypothetical protein